MMGLEVPTIRLSDLHGLERLMAQEQVEAHDRKIRERDEKVESACKCSWYSCGRTDTTSYKVVTGDPVLRWSSSPIAVGVVRKYCPDHERAARDRGFELKT